MKRARIQDVASAAKVSVTSVSRHLNGQIRLPPETARRIDQAAAKLGYRPNVIAQRLTFGKSETLGLITADIAYPLFANIASAAVREAASRGYSLLMYNSRNEADNETAFLARIEDRQVDGVLLLTNHHDDGALLNKINKTGNVVLVDEDVPGARVPRLFADNAKGGYLAARHLLDNAHERIGVIAGPREMISTRERVGGCRQAIAEAGFALSEDCIRYGDYDERIGAQSLGDLMALPEPPTAIFAIGDMLAIGAMRAAHAMGIAIPEDLSLVGFDDVQHADLFSPPLTTVRQSAEELGERGVRMLIDFIEGREDGTAIERIDVDLVVRKSVCPPGSSRTRVKPENAATEAAALQAGGKTEKATLTRTIS